MCCKHTPIDQGCGRCMRPHAGGRLSVACLGKAASQSTQAAFGSLVAALAIVWAIAEGCGKPDSAGPPSPRGEPAGAAHNVQAADRQMDLLSPELRQDRPQRPGFELPAGEHLLPLSRSESEERMERAARLVEAGDLPAALAQLYGCRFDVEDPQMYLVLRAEVEALWFEQQRAFPLATRCAAYALMHYPESVVAAEVRQRLRTRGAWAWRYEGAFAAGSEPEAGGVVGPQYRVQGYTNTAQPSPEDPAASDERLYFVCFPAQLDDYLCSFAFKTRLLPGGRRVAVLVHLAQGRPKVLDVYEQLPAYNQAVREIQRRLALLGSAEALGHDGA